VGVLELDVLPPPPHAETSNPVARKTAVNKLRLMA
jgi:hypothetical protein